MTAKIVFNFCISKKNQNFFLQHLCFFQLSGSLLEIRISLQKGLNILCISMIHWKDLFLLFPSAKLRVKILPSTHTTDNQQIRTEIKEEYILFLPKYLAVLHFIRTFAVEFAESSMIGRWCNGNTTGFGSVIPGSNPSRPTTKRIPKST